MTWRWGRPSEALHGGSGARAKTSRRAAVPSLGDDRWLCAFTALLAVTVAAIPHL